MRVGSLVECVDNSLYSGLIKLNTVYSIRGIIPKGEFVCFYKGVEHYTKVDCIFLDEVSTIGKYDVDIDCPFNIEHFRELQPPIDNIEEHINENTLEEVLTA